MKVSILTNNKSCPNFAKEHGLSIYINHPIYNILFDTGYTDVYLENAEHLGIDLNLTHYIVLSHGHYDHTGGLRFYNTANSLKGIYIHKDAFAPKYKKESVSKFNGIPYKEEDLKVLKPYFIKTSGFTKIAEDIYTLSDIKNNLMDTRYHLEDRIDDFHDEQILIFQQGDGLILFMGCSHFGVTNGIKAVLNRFPGKKIKQLFAGMHLGSKTVKEILSIAKELESLKVEKIYPLHCSGDIAMIEFKEYFKKRCILLKAGDQITI